jgi:replicative DNA helicase Mcm
MMDDIEQFEEFFRRFHEKDLLEASRENKASIEVDFSILDVLYPDLADKLLAEPEDYMEKAREAIMNIDLPGGTVEIEPRFKNLPESRNIRIRNIRSEHIGKMISVDGTVRRASEVKPEVKEAIFQCPDCGAKISVEQKERNLTSPGFCECGRKGKFEMVDRTLFDARWIVIEEPFETATGEKLGEITIYLKNDLTTPRMQKKCDPGNRLKITVVLKEMQKISKGKVKTQMDIFGVANHVETTEVEWEEVVIAKEDEDKIKALAADPEVYNKLIASIAPSIYGLNEVKEAIILQLFGGVPRVMPDKTRIRGDIHILLLGDPSVAKSQLLKLVSKIIPRGKYVSGKGSTAAGLTATVVKDEELMGGWVLEAGAMVLAHKGILAIDEFDKMSIEDQTAMHEALEQQTISIAKASIMATLPAEVSVLAGANPKFSRFDPYRPIAEQISITDTLLSRFDLKFALRDVPDREKDERLATHILETRLNPEIIIPELKPEFIRKYIAYGRKNMKPDMTREAAQALKTFYVEMRSMYTGTDTVPITLRQNEALLRLSEASAKIRLDNKVRVEDANRAIKVMKKSLEQLAYDFETGKIDIDRAEGGMPSSQRGKINAILAIIQKLSESLGKDIPREEIIISAEDEGIKKMEADNLIDRLKTEGMIYEPKPSFIRSMR